MSTIHLFHGTSGNITEKILSYGFGRDKNGRTKELVWNCADDSVTYFYDIRRVVESECIEDYELEEQISFCSERANENARITAALERNPMDHTVVFEIIVNEDDVKDFISPDCSCPNMDQAVTIEDEIINKLIKDGKIKIIIHEYDFIPKLALLYIAGLGNNEYINLSRLSSVEQHAIQSMNNPSFLDSIVDFIYDNAEEIRTYEATKALQSVL